MQDNALRITLDHHNAQNTIELLTFVSGYFRAGKLGLR